jgi:hypothetical protein
LYLSGDRKPLALKDFSEHQSLGKTLVPRKGLEPSRL